MYDYFDFNLLRFSSNSYVLTRSQCLLLTSDYAASQTIVQIGFWTAVNEANQFCQDVNCPIAVGNVTISKVVLPTR